MTDKLLLTGTEAAAALRISVEQFDMIVAEGLVPPIQLVDGGDVHFRRKDLDALLDEAAEGQSLVLEPPPEPPERSQGEQHLRALVAARPRRGREIEDRLARSAKRWLRDHRGETR